MANEKTFKLVTRVSKTFSLAVANFAFATTLLFIIRDRIILTFIPTIISSAVSIIKLRRVRVVISQVKLITKITQIINLRRVRIVYTYRETQKSISTFLLKVRLIIVSKATQKIVSSINLRRVILSISPTIATFFTLGDYDLDTLGAMDVETLGDLDYVET
jgi:hypothetical protein